MYFCLLVIYFYRTLKRYSSTVWKFKTCYFPSDGLKITVTDKCLRLLVTKNHVTRNRDYKQTRKNLQCVWEATGVCCQVNDTHLVLAQLTWNKTGNLRTQVSCSITVLPRTGTPSSHLVTILKIIKLKGIVLSSGHNVDFRSLIWCGWISVHPLWPLRRQ